MCGILSHMNKTLYIMRGLPGSGKSTRAREICHEAFKMGADGAVICSTDSFFIVGGKYVFNRDNIGWNHTQNQQRVEDLMRHKVNVIIVDNTNTTQKEMAPYKHFAVDYGYEIREVIIGAESMRVDLDAYITTCVERNTHGVPRESIEKMARRFQL